MTAFIEGSGLIPAHAGKTAPMVESVSRSAAHPRSRGENVRGSFRPRACTGSSPLTRGKHLEADRVEVGQGLIPAHAGKT